MIFYIIGLILRGSFSESGSNKSDLINNILLFNGRKYIYNYYFLYKMFLYLQKEDASERFWVFMKNRQKYRIQTNQFLQHNLQIQICFLKMSQKIKRKRKNKAVHNLRQFQQPNEASFGEAQNSNEINELDNTLQKHEGEKQQKGNQTTSQNKLKTVDDETVGGQSIDQSLPRPYQFLKFANPPLHTIFVPHFKIKSINFILSIILLVCFIILIIYSYTKSIQNKLTWNCSIFELQNKYYPRIRYGFQFWRVPVSFLFHSNIAHFVLNIIGLQIYGYFVEWYYGKAKYVITLVVAGVMAHFLSCICLPTTVSTMPSAFLFAVIALKIYFLFEYKDYKPLLGRRIFIYLLLGLIFGINLIPIFVNNNVDFTSHIAGLLTGGFMGIFFYIHKKEQQTTCLKVIKFGSIIFIGLIIVISIALMWGLPDNNDNYLALNQNIEGKCSDPTQQ